MQMTLDIFGEDLLIVDVNKSVEKVTELTLYEFLQIDEWKAYPDPKATGESKGVYKLLQPDGKDWRGGWIGKHKSPELAKRAFHDKEVYYAVHGGRDVSERVLKDYPDYLKAQRFIHHIMSKVHIGSGPYVRVETDEGTSHFYMYDFPTFDRVSARGFVQDFHLDKWEVPFKGSFTAREMTAIALSKCLVPHLGKYHYPHLKNEAYKSLVFGIVDKEVTFQVPLEWDNQGHVTKYTIAEGKTAHNCGSCVPRVVVEEAGKLIHCSLYPSQLLAIK